MGRGDGRRRAGEEVRELRVPGACLHVKLRGSGRLLLIIAGGAGDAESSDRLAEHLMDDHTVVTYDRRGYWRSPADDPQAPITIETHAADAHWLLASFECGPADVLGCSIGALIGLDLARRHPGDVRMVVAHEPPVAQLLFEAERADADLLALYRREGAAAAIGTFARSIGVRHEPGRAELGLPQASPRRAQYDREAFFRHDAPAVRRWELDLVALQSVQSQIVVAAGSEGRQYFPYHCAARLADLLGLPLIEFPGTHAGFAEHPAQFAARLRAVLGHEHQGR